MSIDIKYNYQFIKDESKNSYQYSISKCDNMCPEFEYLDSVKLIDYKNEIKIYEKSDANYKMFANHEYVSGIWIKDIKNMIGIGNPMKNKRDLFLFFLSDYPEKFNLVILKDQFSNNISILKNKELLNEIRSKF